MRALAGYNIVIYVCCRLLTLHSEPTFVLIHHVHDLFQTKLIEAIYLRYHIRLVYSVALAFYCRYDELFYYCATHLVVGRENWCERFDQAIRRLRINADRFFSSLFECHRHLFPRYTSATAIEVTVRFRVKHLYFVSVHSLHPV